MKSEHLQQCIIIVLVFYFLFSIFYKCPCTRRTLESMVPNIDIDIPDIDIIVENTEKDTKDTKDTSDDKKDEDSSDNGLRKRGSSREDDSGSMGDVFEYFKDKLISIFSNIQLLVGVGVIVGIIFLGVMVVRKTRTVKSAVSDKSVSDITDSLKNKLPGSPISKDSLKSKIPGLPISKDSLKDSLKGAIADKSMSDITGSLKKGLSLVKTDN